MQCVLCKRPRAANRPKYCSSRCVKSAWYLRNAKPKESVYFGKPQKGILWEEWFIKRYGATRPSEALNTPFDFWWNGERIDLKVCELYHRKTKRGRPVGQTIGWWVFNRNSRNFDFAICIGLVNGVPVKSFKIPNSEMPASGAVISPRQSKYDEFLFDL
jgi:hypothetical protein